MANTVTDDDMTSLAALNADYRARTDALYAEYQAKRDEVLSATLL